MTGRFGNGCLHLDSAYPVPDGFQCSADRYISKRPRCISRRSAIVLLDLAHAPGRMKNASAYSAYSIDVIGWLSISSSACRTTRHCQNRPPWDRMFAASWQRCRLSGHDRRRSHGSRIASEATGSARPIRYSRIVRLPTLMSAVTGMPGVSRNPAGVECRSTRSMVTRPR